MIEMIIAEHIIKDAFHQFILGCKMVVNRRFRNAHLAGNHRQTGLLNAMKRKQSDGGLNDLLRGQVFLFNV